MSNLEINGHIMKKGFVENSNGEMCSPITHISTIYSGDRTLDDILDEMTEKKEQEPDINRVDFTINPNDWISGTGDQVYVDLVSENLKDDYFSEVITDHNGMVTMVEYENRWLICDNASNNTIRIYTSYRMQKSINVTIIQYYKYTSYAVTIPSGSWVYDSATELYKATFSTPVVTNDMELLLSINSNNIHNAAPNNFMCVESGDGEIYVYAQTNTKTLACNLVVIGHSISYRNPEEILLPLNPYNIDNDLILRVNRANTYNGNIGSNTVNNTNTIITYPEDPTLQYEFVVFYKDQDITLSRGYNVTIEDPDICSINISNGKCYISGNIKEGTTTVHVTMEDQESSFEVTSSQNILSIVDNSDQTINIGDSIDIAIEISRYDETTTICYNTYIIDESESIIPNMENEVSTLALNGEFDISQDITNLQFIAIKPYEGEITVGLYDICTSSIISAGNINIKIQE